jgi:hypothetical protein
MSRFVVLVSASTTVTLGLLAAAVAAANFAPGIGALAALLVVPLTIGLPTTVVAAAVTCVWPGSATGLYAASCAVLGLASQAGAFALVARLRRRR